ncbi:MAG: inositol phosphate phosphatase SopB [Pantoea sp.]|uniref:inositol phosphate phosphatase SopB n=1 Tax=Pantoea sp. TaxID=69393 RepID=UPI002398A2CA|nr:inositol phosphate phosphatase SopB [Pantoea sp.]MDE1186628.1 inositol phosphate phosphatase SopB [Pantoea sp.]
MIRASISHAELRTYDLNTEQIQPRRTSQDPLPFTSGNAANPYLATPICPGAGGDISPPARSVNALLVFQTDQLKIAEFVMDKLKLNKSTLQLMPGLLKTTDSGIDIANKEQINASKKLNSKLIDNISTAFSNKHRVPLKDVKSIIKKEFKAAAIKIRNSNNWDKINTNIAHGGHNYTSTLTPAGKMKTGSHDIFQQSYLDKGVCSASTTDTQHATNLWMSEITAPDKDGRPETLFNGIRHGILSPYGLKKSDPARQAGAITRAKEVLTAALYAKSDLLQRALSGQVVPFNLVSTSLATASKTGKEDGMVADQMHAWQALTQQTPLSLTIRDKQGELKQIKVNLKVVAFSLGVNEMALKFKLGWTASDKYNDQALKQLFGPELKFTTQPQGMVGEYLKTNPENGEKVRELSQQLRDIFIKKSHHHDGGEPYKAAQRIAMLAYEIGAVPCWNCKSGKDRTGMLDAEIKREVISQHQGKPLSQPGRLQNKADKELFQNVLVNGGNAEVQVYNTSVAGNKVIKSLPLPGMNLSFNERIGNNQVLKATQGLSKLVYS